MNNTRQIVVITGISFLIYTISHNARTGELPQARQFLAWGILLVALVALGDFEQTEQVGAAMAYLIALVVFLLYGSEFFVSLVKALGETMDEPTPRTVRLTDGRYAGKEVPI